MAQDHQYSSLLSTKRLRKSTASKNSDVEEFFSDRSRIVFASSFRRLQQKAQVFSLESNSTIRTRLIHSIEVSDHGRRIAWKIAIRLANEGRLAHDDVMSVVAIVENACLLHDIGNPPFGHFGETAIANWAKNELPKLWEDEPDLSMLLEALFADFREFDGNPQGFRTVTKLHTGHDEFSLNLSYATLLCALKYARAAGEKAGDGVKKKAGYFMTERAEVEKIRCELGIKSGCRYPLTYIMEAADDIAYCMSDIADGIEKRVLTTSDFVTLFNEMWKKDHPDVKLPVPLPQITEIKDFYKQIVLRWSEAARNEAVMNFFALEDGLWDGSTDSIIVKEAPVGRVLDIVKKVSHKILYNSIEAESIELTGYAVITGILKHYERVLKMPYDEFAKLISGNDTKGYDVERMLFHRLGGRFVGAYTHAVNKLTQDSSLSQREFKAHEIWLRVHLLIDNISGMTDDFALQTYQMLHGITLHRR